MIKPKYPFQYQLDQMDCAPACLKMISSYFGKDHPLEYLRDISYLSREGVSLLSVNDAAEELGFRTLMVKLTYEKLLENFSHPCILHWNQEHFIVLYEIKRKNFFKRILQSPNGNSFQITIGDPAHGVTQIDATTFKSNWISNVEEKGVALMLEPTNDFYTKNIKNTEKKGYGFLFKYLIPYKKQVAQLILGMGVASFIALIFPFLMRLLIDYGVSGKDLSIVNLVILSQLFLFIGTIFLDIIRSWLLLHINARVSLNIISDFLIKLLKLPIKFFDTKAVGDIAQRINDHHRIESFLTGASLVSLFSIINIITFTIVLWFYNWKILLVFAILSISGVLWVLMFRKRRQQLDYKKFARNKENQDKLYEMINGMQEIKLYGSETVKRWDWEQLQVKYFKLNIRSLILEQYQNTGFNFFIHSKNILISFIAATEAIKGNMSLGTLLSISYIIGQTNTPLENLVNFFKSAQDARLSLDRLQEIHNKVDEEDLHEIKNKLAFVGHEDIKIEGLSFQYEGPNSNYVLDNINLNIPKGKTTAIVGTSGSGKTTLLKLLLNFYNPTKGRISIGDKNLSAISPKGWRNQCGTVMQDGYIFYDTVTKNIALDGKELNHLSLENAINVANLREFVENLPLGYTTKIGNSGIGLSGGQKQRILIARSVYKNPDYLFFDEATSSLDANNERVIMNNLDSFFKGRTVVVIAHRLSTVKNADQIIVLEKGQIVEVGNHDTLTKEKGKYFELVKNQLELGN
jgi:ATP-binding cassette subfamily B protein